MCNANDGFHIAHEDLKIRSAREIFGLDKKIHLFLENISIFNLIILYKYSINKIL